MVMSADPLKLVPLIVRAVCSVAAVLALPVKAAVIVPALKLPLASRDTIAETVLSFVAVVALLDTLPDVLIVASLVSTIAADVEISAFTILVARFNLL